MKTKFRPIQNMNVKTHTYDRRGENMFAGLRWEKNIS